MKTENTSKNKGGDFNTSMNAWAKMFSKLCAMYGRSVNERQQDAIYEEIKLFKPYVLDKTLTKWARTQPKMPSANEIIYMANLEDAMERKARGEAMVIKSQFEQQLEREAIDEFKNDPRNLIANEYNKLLIGRECRTAHDFMVLSQLKGEKDVVVAGVDGEAVQREVAHHSQRLGDQLPVLLAERLKYTTVESATEAWKKASRGENWRNESAIQGGYTHESFEVGRSDEFSVIPD